MAEKPTTAAGYTSDHLDAVRSTCLYVATKLGDLVDDIVVVGGLVPSLLIDQKQANAGAEEHVGTMDLDLGLTVALLDQGRYRTLTERLRRAGFSQDSTSDGRATRQRWKIDDPQKVTVDFLIPPSFPEDRGGELRDIEPDFAAVIAPGLDLAFEDRQQVTLSGETVKGEFATREIWVCGPGAYVVLKALAFDLRGENKDAYDLYYVLRNYGSGVEEVAACLCPFRDDDVVSRALSVLQRDFLDHDGPGPRRVAAFGIGSDDAIQADVVGFVKEFLQAVTPA